MESTAGCREVSIGSVDGGAAVRASGAVSGETAEPAMGEVGVLMNALYPFKVGLDMNMHSCV